MRAELSHQPLHARGMAGLKPLLLLIGVAAAELWE
jgi:hypothetical protein